ncbi:patatin-like phospholipase family protein [Solimonas sp. K1W22B-7]|uniref:patatin-like phospholipase family protein n=1 Tax=Solimonas sp. K1W22B-7 TaxID=2303331 RepID=UPI001F091A2F|nr:patatin-like phospholipase family protein [Solimonas sp. K1W22B-7]
MLTAGGARGAYQAGVLKRISELPRLRGKPLPFPIITGASAGAINGAAMASYHGDFGLGAELLAKLWAQLTVTDVFRTDTAALARGAADLVLDMALGGLTGAGRTQALVDTAPLQAFLGRHLPLENIAKAIDRGGLEAIAVTATGYHSGKAFTFVQGRPGRPLWNKSRRVALATTLTLDHIRASASIPIVFPPVPLSAGGSTAWFGDGALRLTTPLSPAIRLGAERLFAIGVRCQESADSLLRSELSTADDVISGLNRPPLAQICGVFMNAIFLDHLDADLDHLKRMNELVAAYQQAARGKVQEGVSEPMRILRPLVISPSADIAIIAKTLAHRMPRSIRYVLDGLGTPDAQSADLTSYLLFDTAFTRELISLGYRDAAQRIDEIEDFLLAD